MEKIDKFVRKLRLDIARKVLETLRRIRQNDVEHLDVKKLRGNTNEYRVRIGPIRIKFEKIDGLNVITDIENRHDNTYSVYAIFRRARTSTAS